MSALLLKMKEHELYKIWTDQKFSRNLTTIDGKQINVLFPGVRNKLEGPDFNNAFIEINGTPYKGDIEIHVLTSDWYKHNHNYDMNYNNVILHVVYRHDYKYNKVVNERKKGIFTLELKSRIYLEKSRSKENYCLISQLKDKVNLEEFLTLKGLEKFYSKSEQYRLMSHSTSLNQIFYMAMLDSFGYSRNREPMKKLSQVISYSYLIYLMQNYSREAVTGFLLHICDLFGHIPVSVSMSRVLCFRNAYHNEFKSNVTIKKLKMDWNMFRVRPVNHPVLRIMQIVNLFSRDFDFFSLFSELFENTNKKITGAELYRHFIKANQVEVKISRTMFDKIMVNVFLPLLHADYSNRKKDNSVAENMEKCVEFYLGYNKLEQNHIEKRALSSLTQGLKPDFKLKAVHQQGLNFLYKNYCKNRLCQLCSADFS